MSDNETQYQGKSVTAYCDPWTFRAGDDVEWRASSHKKTAGVLEVVRLECGDPTRSGPGFSECIVSDLEAMYLLGAMKRCHLEELVHVRRMSGNM